MTMKSNFFPSKRQITPSMIGTAGIFDSVHQGSELMVSQLVEELCIWFPPHRDISPITQNRESMTQWVYEQLNHPIGHDDVLAYLTLELQMQLHHESCQ